MGKEIAEREMAEKLKCMTQQAEEHKVVTIIDIQLCRMSTSLYLVGTCICCEQ